MKLLAIPYSTTRPINKARRTHDLQQLLDLAVKRIARPDDDRGAFRAWLGTANFALGSLLPQGL